MDDDTETPREPPGRSAVSTFFAETPPDVEAWLQRRRDLGLDGRDEIWEGVLHVTPYEHRRNTRTAQRLARLVQDAADAVGLEVTGPFNLGTPEDFRIPDLALIQVRADDALYNEGAAVVVEVLSPHDETFAKFGFYAAHGVQELWVVDPLTRSVRMWQLGVVRAGQYEETARSELLGVTAASVAQDLNWPQG